MQPPVQERPKYLYVYLHLAAAFSDASSWRANRIVNRRICSDRQVSCTLGMWKRYSLFILCPKTFNPLRCMHIYFLSTDSLSLVTNTWLLMISPDVLTILGTFSLKLLDKLNFVTKNRISNLELLWFWFTTPSDCFGKLFSPSQPIG